MFLPFVPYDLTGSVFDGKAGELPSLSLMFVSIYASEVDVFSAWECFVAVRALLAQIGSEPLKESYQRAVVGAPETDFLFSPFLNPGACCGGLEENPLP